MTLDECLVWARQQLSEHSPTAALDARLLAGHLLQADQAGVFREGRRELTPAQQQQFAQWVARRQQGEPLAYITGTKAFYGHDFLVTPATLIPRPETELLVAAALQLGQAEQPLQVVDLGTGSGAIAISLALARPQWEVLGIDQSEQALAVARQNASRLAADSSMRWQQGNWLSGIDQVFDLVVSNPPYIADGDAALADNVRRYEPPQALFADQDGLADLRVIAGQAAQALKAGGWLLLEHGYQQGKAVRDLLHQAGFEQIATVCDLAGHERVTQGCFAGSR